jgi:hypothetical protein
MLDQNLATIIVGAEAHGIRALAVWMETPPTRGGDYTIEFHRVFPWLAT